MKIGYIYFALAISAVAAQGSFARTEVNNQPIDEVAGPYVPPDFLRVKDHKMMPSSACHHYSTGSSLAVADLKYLSYALTNGSTSSNVVLCPIVRDNTTNLDGMAKVEVQIYNPTAGIEFECFVKSYGEYGAAIATGSDSTTAAGNHTLEIDVAASEPAGYYVLNCILPPTGTYTSKLFAYGWQEFATTDDDN